MYIVQKDGSDRLMVTISSSVQHQVYLLRCMHGRPNTEKSFKRTAMPQVMPASMHALYGTCRAISIYQQLQHNMQPISLTYACPSSAASGVTDMTASAMADLP